MKAVLYRRVSTGQQDLSLDAQEQRLQDYAKFKGLTLVETFADDAVSGTMPINERTGGANMLTYLRYQPDVKHIIVAKLDRLGRRASDVLRTVAQLREQGITIHFADMGGDSMSSAGAMGQLMLCVLSGMAEFEVEMIRARTLDAMQHKRRRGEKLGGNVPYGFDLVGGHWIRNEAEQVVVTQIQAMHELGHNCNRIKSWLNEQGHPAKQGGRWTYLSVRGVLRAKCHATPHDP